MFEYDRLRLHAPSHALYVAPFLSAFVIEKLDYGLVQ